MREIFVALGSFLSGEIKREQYLSFGAIGDGYGLFELPWNAAKGSRLCSHRDNMQCHLKGARRNSFHHKASARIHLVAELTAFAGSPDIDHQHDSGRQRT